MKRWFVVRPIKLKEGEIKAGVYLTKAQTEEIPHNLFRTLVNRVCIMDNLGEIDIPWRERNKLRLRHRALMEIGSEEATKLHDQSVEMMARGRDLTYKSPREKAIAEQERLAKIEHAKKEAAKAIAKHAPIKRKRGRPPKKKVVK